MLKILLGAAILLAPLPATAFEGHGGIDAAAAERGAAAQKELRQSNEKLREQMQADQAQPGKKAVAKPSR